MSTLGITFDSDIKFSSNHKIVLSGTVSGDQVSGVKLFDADTSASLGSAQVQNGKWTFTETLPQDQQIHGFKATALSGANSVSTNSPSSVVSGLTNRPYTSVVEKFDQNTGRLRMEFHADNGSLEYHGAFQADPASGGSIFVETGDSAHTHFVFDNTTVDQSITNFHAKGSSHDVLELPHSDFTNLADVIRNTTMSHGAAVIHDTNAGVSITLAGVSKTELKSHPHDFSFNGPGSFLPA